MLLSMGRAYAAVSENVQAEKYYREYIALAQTIKNIAYDYYAFSHIAWYYVNHGQYDKAEEYFNTAMEGWPKSNMSGAAFNKSAFILNWIRAVVNMFLQLNIYRNTN